MSITYPAPGQTGVPATGWDRDSFQPGSDHGRGGARNRIVAVLTSARPYTGASGGIPVSDELPAGSMTITNESTGEQVPLKSSYPRSVPYGSDAGEHVIDTQPADNLTACTWYRVDVSSQTPVLDARGSIVTPYSWQFQTECDETGSTTTTTLASPTTSTSTTLPAPTTNTTPSSSTSISTPVPTTVLRVRSASKATATAPATAQAATKVVAVPRYAG